MKAGRYLFTEEIYAVKLAKNDIVGFLSSIRFTPEMFLLKQFGPHPQLFVGYLVRTLLSSLCDQPKKT